MTQVAIDLGQGDGQPDTVTVNGTAGDDQITLQPADATSGQVGVTLNGQDLGTFAPTGKVVVFGLAGNDTIQLLALTTDTGSVPSRRPYVISPPDPVGVRQYGSGRLGAAKWPPGRDSCQGVSRGQTRTAPPVRMTSTSTVGLPRESRISRA